MKKVIGIITLFIFCVTGCSFTNDYSNLLVPQEENSSNSQNEIAVTSINSIDPTTVSSSDTELEVKEKTVEDLTVKEGAVNEDASLVASESLSTEQLNQLMKKQQGLYAYDMMGDSYHVLYVEIFYILTNRQENIKVSSVNPEDIEYAFQCVLNDHPEIFYVKGYTYTKHTKNNVTQKITVSGTYTMDAATIETMNIKIEQYVLACVSGISKDASEYEKVKYCYEYLVNHTVYNLNASENQNICSVFVYGESVCQGYAKAMQYLLTRLSISSTLVLGTVDNGEGHAWNLVNIDGAYYYVDATWGDAFYVFSDAKTADASANIPSINYDYLCVTTDQLCQTHTIDNVVPMPYCVATQANYYIREGAYFTTVDEEKIRTLFNNAYTKQSNYVTLKCESADLYQKMQTFLIGDQNVFRYMQESTETVAYTYSEEQLTISFWL